MMHPVVWIFHFPVSFFFFVDVVVVVVIVVVVVGGGGGGGGFVDLRGVIIK